MRHKLLTLLFFTVAHQASAASLSLDDYLTQVRQQNGGVQSATSQAAGAQGLAREADLIFAPKFFAEARVGYDEKVSQPAFISYDRANSQVYSMGISQKTSFGLDAKLSYSLTNAKLDGIDTSLTGGIDGFAETAATLELAMPLWANGFGRTVRASEELTRQQQLAAQYGAEAQSHSLLVNAEVAYWRLAAALDQLKIEQISLKSGQSILSYVKDKSRKDLGETADVIQASALVEAYNLQVEQAENEVRRAQRDFNLYLNKAAQTPVGFELQPLDYNMLKTATAPAQRPGDRLDVRATIAQAKLAEASSVVANERNKPSLDLYSAFTTYGQAPEIRDAIGQSGKFEKDGAYIGLRFSVPLNLSALSDARDGAERTKQAAEQNAAYAKFTQDQQWTEISESVGDMKRSLLLAEKIEAVQKSKLDNERSRLRQGRTTTYQVLLFEQDYNRSQASRIQIATQILKLQSQIKLYVASVESGE